MKERALEDNLPSVSIVMPIYNEARSIDTSLASVLGQDYPPHLTEILIAERRSDDGTSERIRRIAAQHHDRRLRLLENPGRTPGAAMNRMIREAEGDIIVRVDGHAEIAADYVRRCVSALQDHDALNVGGCISAVGYGYMGRAIAMAIESFWGNGGARYRSPPCTAPVYVDTVQFGAWRRETLLALGPFVEWPVNEDCEFNARILDAGGRILLHPAIRAVYYPRRSLVSLARQYFRYGKLKCRVIARHPSRLRVRQVIPMVLVLSLVAPWAITAGADWEPSLALSTPLAYLGGLGMVSLHLSARRKRAAGVLLLPAVFATLHLSYGLGTLLGMGALFKFLRKKEQQFPLPETRPDEVLRSRLREQS